MKIVVLNGSPRKGGMTTAPNLEAVVKLGELL